MTDSRAAVRAVAMRRRADPAFELPAADLLTLARLLHEAGRPADALAALAEHIRRFPGRSDRVRLQAAALLLDHKPRPATALKVLAPVDRANLSEADAATYRELSNRAERCLEDGALELRDETFG